MTVFTSISVLNQTKRSIHNIENQFFQAGVRECRYALLQDPDLQSLPRGIYLVIT